jgi:hypothetical protein
VCTFRPLGLDSLLVLLPMGFQVEIMRLGTEGDDDELCMLQCRSDIVTLHIEGAAVLIARKTHLKQFLALAGSRLCLPQGLLWRLQLKM